MNKITIDFDKQTLKHETCLVGYDFGCEFAENYKDIFPPNDLFECDKVIISLPDRILTMNKSFIRGIFKDVFGKITQDKFLELYEFQCSDYNKDKIKKTVCEIYQERAQK